MSDDADTARHPGQRPGEGPRERPGQPADQRPARPRVLASTASLMMHPLGWALDVIAEAGFTGAELLLTHQRPTRDVPMIEAFLRETGLDLPAVHGPYMLLLRSALGRDYRTKTARSLEIAGELGAQVMIAHAPFRWERRALGWLRDGEAEQRADATGVAFGMENLFPVRGRALSAVISPEDLAPYPHVVFDTSHFAVAGIDLLTAWDALADRVVHIHLSDNQGAGRDSHAPIGTGVLPLQAFLARVGASGFAGTITLELDCRAHRDDRRGLVAFLDQQRRVTEALLDGAGPPLPSTAAGLDAASGLDAAAGLDAPAGLDDAAPRVGGRSRGRLAWTPFGFTRTGADR